MSKSKTQLRRLNDWQVLDKMAQQNKDIRAFRHVLGIELKGKKGQRYSELKIQIDEQTHQDIAEMMLYGGYVPSKKIVVCYVIDRKEFDEIQNKPQ